MSAWRPLNVPATGEKPFTDYKRWRLLVNDGGRHTWHYLRTNEEMEKWPQNDVDRYSLGLEVGLPELPAAKDALDAARNGYKFYKHLQSHDGHWAGEYGGPMFLLPGLVIGSYVTGMPFKEEERLEMIRYLFNRAHPEDGGWGIHVEGHSTVFGTGLNYTALRILGVDKDHPVCVKARATLHKLGGCTSIPSWGKFWLSLLNAYDWEGNNPVPPELWLLPDWVPFHPHKWWIHTRNVYIPMSYLYGVKFQMEENDLILSLREELYPEDYYMIKWPDHRNNINKVDVYAPHSAVFDAIGSLLSLYEGCVLPPLRRAANARAYRLIVMEDENTEYQTLGPVSKMFNLIARVHAEGRESVAFKEHMIKRQDFMWVNAEGMMMCGTNGSQLWDIGFITQALVETGLAEEEENKESLLKALEWLDQAQIRTNPKHYVEAYRHTTKGAWGFSTAEQGYTVITTCHNYYDHHRPPPHPHHHYSKCPSCAGCQDRLTCRPVQAAVSREIEAEPALEEAETLRMTEIGITKDPPTSFPSCEDGMGRSGRRLPCGGIRMVASVQTARHRSPGPPSDAKRLSG